METKNKNLSAYSLIIMMCLFCLSAYGQKITEVEYRSVPETAKTFIRSHFPGQSVERAMINRVTGVPTYNIVMRNKSEIIFTTHGEWKEADGHGNSLPITILPKKAIKYLNNHNLHYGAKRIVKNTDGGYNVSFNNNKEVKFDKNGKHIDELPVYQEPNRQER